MIYRYYIYSVYTTKTDADYRFTSTLGERPKIQTLYALGMRDIHTHNKMYHNMPHVRGDIGCGGRR